MAANGVFLFFGLVFGSFSCEGKINPPPGGNSLVVSPGSTVSINWTFTDDPTRSILEWYFIPGDGSPQELLATKYPYSEVQLQNSSLSRVTIESPATLVLTNVDRNYSGTYFFVLKVAGLFKNQESEVDVLIAQKPNLTFRNCTSSTSVTVNKGDNFTCVCESKGGNPPANVSWYKDGVRIVEPGKAEKSLILINVDIKDSGSYKCIAQSHTLTDQKSIQILVFYPIPPSVISFKSIPKKTLLGESVVITCEALAVPLPRYTIIHNDTVVVSAHKTYIITVLKYSHAGSYKCIVKNQLGNSSKTFSLSVVEAQKTNTPSLKSNCIGTDRKPESKESQSYGTEWYIVLISSVTTFIIGILVSYVVFYFRCKHRSRKRQQNYESPKSQVDKTYQELDLTKMNTGENYQTLTAVPGAAASNESVREDDSTYTELSKTRDIEENYQSLT